MSLISRISTAWNGERVTSARDRISDARYSAQNAAGRSVDDLSYQLKDDLSYQLKYGDLLGLGSVRDRVYPNASNLTFFNLSDLSPEKRSEFQRDVNDILSRDRQVRLGPAKIDFN